ncbi:hypothetical protein M5G15_23160, partial [Pseudomonas shahriarae]
GYFRPSLAPGTAFVGFASSPVLQRAIHASVVAITVLGTLYRNAQLGINDLYTGRLIRPDD